jgi:outer membrane protein OmpA-like peptidoglycan-associated protein
MSPNRIIRQGVFIVLTLAICILTTLPGSAQQCSDLLNAEFTEAEQSGNYDAFIEKYNPCELAFVAVERLAAPFIARKDWPAAIEIFERYKGHFPNMHERFSAIIGTLAAPAEGLAVENLGRGVNTAQNEFRPVLSADGTTLYFSRDCGECDGGEDIFYSFWDGVSWGWARELKKPISTRDHEMVTGLSSGGNTMLIFGNYPDSFGRGDIFYSEREAECWSPVKHYPAPVNSSFFDSDATITADGKAILFISERPDNIGEFRKKDDFSHGGYGGNTDIYVAVDTAEGMQVINLGATINTPYSEYSPFLHPDGKTLYFSSDGHAGLGGLDVFKATRLRADSWTEWSEPENLGKEINGPFNDWGYQVSTDGRHAFFSAAGRPDGFGGKDIYAITMPAKAKPLPVVTVSGKVTDPEGRPLAAALRWNDLDQQEQVGANRSDPTTGSYFIALPAGHRYSYHAEKAGYIGKSESFDLRGKEKLARYELDIVLFPVEQLKKEEVAIRLNNIFFDFDKYDLRPESFQELDRWVKFLLENRDMRMEIDGHTDSIGSDAYNQKLSTRRAEAVVNYLVEKGVDKARITAVGFGESQPVATNDTPEGRQLNRRVEIKFVNSQAK